MLMLPFGTLWSEATPEDLIEISVSKASQMDTCGNKVPLDFHTRSIDLLMTQPLDAAFYLHSQIYCGNQKVKAIVRDTILY